MVQTTRRFLFTRAKQRSKVIRARKLAPFEKKVQEATNATDAALAAQKLWDFQKKYDKEMDERRMAEQKTKLIVLPQEMVDKQGTWWERSAYGEMLTVEAKRRSSLGNAVGQEFQWMPELLPNGEMFTPLPEESTNEQWCRFVAQNETLLQQMLEEGQVEKINVR